MSEKKYKSCTVNIGEYCSKHGVVHKEMADKFIDELKSEIREFLNTSLVFGYKGDKELYDRATQVFAAFIRFVEEV